MKVLYTSGDVHRAIKQIFANRRQRRIAVVAYLGEAAEAFLPSPEGMKIICSPEPGATSPKAVRSLIRRGAEVQFADDLHAKIYWSESGCVVTSANISGRALGNSNQKEAGVLISGEDFDIERLIREVQPRKIIKRDVDRLEMQDRKLRVALGIKDVKEERRDFLQWYKTPYATPWKFGWWCGSDLTIAKSAKEITKRDYNVIEPEDALSVTKSQVQRYDWLLCFEIATQSVRNFQWMFVDFVVPVNPKDKPAYNKSYPFQAIQVHKSNRYPRPPFALDRSFATAFKTAIKQYGLDKIENSRSLVPTKKFVTDLAKYLENDWV